MGHSGSHRNAKLTSKPRPGRSRDRRRKNWADQVDAPYKPTEVLRLAAEVDRLQRELAAARRRMMALEARADLDPLTSLPNRHVFQRELSRSLAYVKRHGTRAALLYLDLDRFKLVNDRHGHAAGDLMLRMIADALKRHVRTSDVVARIGGDEFAILLWNCDEAAALEKALALEVAVAGTTARYRGAALTVGASVGVAPLMPSDQAAEALGRADAAMYARKLRKRHGRAAE